MQHFLFCFFGAIAGYVCGSLSSAVIVCRAMGFGDPRTLGSGNPGATNVLRIAGEKAAAITLAGDLLKGLIPVVVFIILRRFFPAGIDDLVIVLVGLGAFFGHLYPIFFNFEGGKGVATAFGVLLAWNPIVALLGAAIWGAVFYNTRISSLSALSAAAFVAIASIFYTPGKDWAYMLTAVFIIVGMLFYRHRSNIERLLKGEEAPFGGGKMKDPFADEDDDE
ncbi:MAG: glycerol-3-phosphate 1-O-acyltransferase [Cardiobacterium sp.]|jgi:acyl-phosphate glycerol 3-phosphate acyltransferase|uniref:glycerol-3-phosphate 1-O-acyltransferase PlsY n=1 Tax=Cardiobacterium sp. Marseille-Q4385 TaxID=2866573 RepID=UPI000F17BC01|nr:glycerol-3-phosphate 1-O-acyltransferase PlsY [Cardiobacterium sp. Marseille-Q4385]RKW10255.1 MAG: glycerol-3-phosphate 1-O-acyltransferase [Cardiobacterium sp.]